MPHKISSLSHPLVKHLIKLRQDAAYRRSCQSCLVMGKHAVLELMVLHTPKLIFSPDPAHTQTTEEIFKKITGLPSPEPFLAEFPLPTESSLETCSSVLVMDRIADPGNLGSLLRTALALNWEGIFFLPGCVDPFNDKVLRSSKAALFRLRYQHGSLEQLFLLSKNFCAYVADLQGIPLHQLSKPKKPLLVLSHEATGVDPQLNHFGTKVTIPITKMESLNVAGAGAILMYEMGTWKTMN
ncbi:MAG: RNA methyltransferase [Verrucomicrobia bacterium]|nr:RNA methyltransferase [Verrucomicrobiota bacterium]MBS0646671.1 RNA methyltransferase [Verrucomicrobiota bacterium]